MSCTKPEVKNLSDYRCTCRVCMKNNNSMKELFGSDCKIVDKIQFCTGILLQENPNLPSFICAECLSHLSIAHNFKTTCIASDEIFKKDIKVEVKTEIFKDITVKEEIENLYEDGIEVDDSKDTVEFLIGRHLNPTVNIIRLPSVIPKKVVKESTNKKPKAVRKKQNTTKDKLEKPPTKKKVGERQIVFRKLQCLKCNIRFESKEESIVHHETLHNTTKYICDVCGKQFVYQASLFAHMRIHGTREYACEQCSYTTVNKSDLKKHMTVHTGEKNFHCHVCPGEFRTSSNLRNHIRHNHGGKKTFPCDRCDKSFFTGHRLRRHLDSHNNVKRHECPVCHSCFTRRCHWKIHLLKQHAVKTPPAKPGRVPTRKKTLEEAGSEVV